MTRECSLGRRFGGFVIRSSRLDHLTADQEHITQLCENTPKLDSLGAGLGAGQWAAGREADAPGPTVRGDLVSGAGNDYLVLPTTPAWRHNACAHGVP